MADGSTAGVLSLIEKIKQDAGFDAAAANKAAEVTQFIDTAEHEIAKIIARALLECEKLADGDDDLQEAIEQEVSGAIDTKPLHHSPAVKFQLSRLRNEGSV